MRITLRSPSPRRRSAHADRYCYSTKGGEANRTWKPDNRDTPDEFTRRSQKPAVRTRRWQTEGADGVLLGSAPRVGLR
ncbi:hypothetical protein EYF80_038032 [Liparis tanakae]|uniref:Uncharacterized protein n=1 Tax=Liparis tanakae TaxID=230148 RepID=A0A4Z2GEU4_9TELE|nr:hypothetical protein EYF80_038032 [Liparis tanakae]